MSPTQFPGQSQSLSDLLEGRHVFVTGGTGSFGSRFVQRLLRTTSSTTVVAFSRDPLKQIVLRSQSSSEPRLRLVLGDVADSKSLVRALRGASIVIHAAALKHVPEAEDNPLECIRTNVNGCLNLIDAAVDCGVERVLGISTDKASSPVNLYGATKMIAERLLIGANDSSRSHPTHFSIVRYGNVLGSSGSFVRALRALPSDADIPVTDPEMTRFWISPDQAVDFVLLALHSMRGGEIFVPRMPSMKVVDVAAAIAPGRRHRVVGRRPGEKVHEELIGSHESHLVRDCGQYFVVCRDSTVGGGGAGGAPVDNGFRYSSDQNNDWLDASRLMDLVNSVG